MPGVKHCKLLCGTFNQILIQSTQTDIKAGNTTNRISEIFGAQSGNLTEVLGITVLCITAGISHRIYHGIQRN